MEDFPLQGYLGRAARAYPRRTALADDRRTLTYAELDALSARVAGALAVAGVGPGRRVALYLTRTVHPVVAMFGALRAGAAYVPLDPRAPDGRLRGMLGDCRPAALICDSATAGRAGDLAAAGGGPCAVVDLDALPDAAGGAPAIADPSPDDVACVLYTSGSTGRPKGVMLSHRNIRAYIDWAVGALEIGDRDVILGTAPFHFDMSLFDVYAPVSAGARLAVASEGRTLFPRTLVEFAEQQRATIWKGVASLLMYLQRTGVLAPQRLPTLRAVLFAGETLPTRYLKAWMETFPDKTFYNAYGPTEATGVSLVHRIRVAPADASEPIPIGRPCEGSTDVVLLGDDGRPAAHGQIGELCIAGPCLTPGYLDAPEATARAFLDGWSDGSSEPRRLYRTGDLARVDDDGVYWFVGRADRQVKVMGYRIELGEIEAVLQAAPGVRDAAVVCVEDPDTGLPALAAFIEAGEGAADDALHGHLGERLPAYMVPKRLVRVARLPRNDRGKLDRDALDRLALDPAAPGRSGPGARG